MSTIKSSPDGKWFIVTFFEDVVEEEVTSNEEKGWKITTGLIEGEGVPIRAYYRQDRYTLDAVKKAAENLRECPICQRLGKDMSVTSIDVDNNYVRQVQQPVKPIAPAAINSGFGDVGELMMNMLLNDIIDTTLTPIGKIFTAKLTGNDALLEHAQPKTNEEMMSLAADFFDVNTPNDMIFRNPEEMKKRAKALRAGTKKGEEEDTETLKKHPVFKRAQTMIIS